MRVHPVEKLRRIWTPGREIEEVVAALDPQSETDSILRHFLWAILAQHGSQTIDLGSEIDPVINEGTLRWETVHGPGPDDAPELRRRQVTLWLERE